MERPKAKGTRRRVIVASDDQSDINLETKLRPAQARAQDTYELVLVTAGDMLGEMGFEQLTTNAICTRAGLTPPALYRYFPNKYTILKVLGERLMKAQDDVVIDWIETGGLEGDSFEARLAKNVAIQRQVVTLTQQFPGGAAIGRALRAVPILQRLRFESRDMVADRFYQMGAQRYPKMNEQRLRAVMRLMIELTYAATEMVVEEPDRDAEIIIQEVSLMFAHYFEILDAER